jgi:hypothetical protein
MYRISLIFLEFQANIHAVFGTFACSSGSRYLVVCTDADIACTVKPLSDEGSGEEGRIYRALKCELVPYNSEAQISDDEARLLASVDRLLSSGTFYFTAIGDEIGRNCLLQTCQRRRETSRAVATDIPESIFLWNHTLIRKMAEAADDNNAFLQYISPLTQGFAQSRSFADGGIWHSVSVVSRRSTRQAGTRYNARGIDDEGNVAIFTETECIVTSSVGVEGTEVFSFVQIRGSVPVFWSQPSSVSVEINRNFDMSKLAFQRHLDFLKYRYDLTARTPDTSKGKLVFVNLLSTSKSAEALLSSALSNHIRFVSGSEPVVMVEFDFHKYVNSSRPLEESLIPLMDALRPYIFHFGYFEDRPGCTIDDVKQDGILRTNCLDCLDRTNAVQMQIAWESVMMSKFSSFPKESPLFKEVFTDIWVRNGDAISKGYSGTGSVLSRLVKTAGKGGSSSIATMIEHSWRSANRFIAANWDDSERQAAISKLLGTHHPALSSDSLTRDLTVWVGSFNVHGRRVDEQLKSLSDFIGEPTDIVIACFQETIDLTAGSVLFSTRGDDERNRVIDLQLLSVLEQLNQGQEAYIQVANESLVGLYITVFTKTSLSSKIDSVKSRRFKAGFGGAAGNKGSVSVSFRIFHSVEIEIVNLHLDSGVDKAEERMQQLAFVLENASTHKHSLLTAPKNHHHRHRSRVAFICGDFNFRCDGISPQLAIELVSKGRVEKLRTFDPFVSTAANDGNVLKAAGFREMPLTFNPTYKYEHDNSLSDRRTPSWCDRIFYRSNLNEKIELDAMHYNSIETSRLSDHKPVVGLFALRPRQTDGIEETVVNVSAVSSTLSNNPAPRLSPDPVDLLSGDLVEAAQDQSDKSEAVHDDDKFVDLLL